MPATAGIHGLHGCDKEKSWIPAFAGMTCGAAFITKPDGPSGRSGLLAERTAVQVLQLVLAARGLRIDLQQLLPGGVSAFPVLAGFGDQGKRAQRGEVARLVFQGLLDVGDGALRVAGGKARHGALMV